MGGAAADGAADTGPRLLRLDAGQPAAAPIPAATALRVRTDRDILTLRRIERPAWASAMGRDRFGLWAEIAVAPSAGPPVVQRLRWIPPGRFLMGSPEDEPGRREAEGPRHPVTLTTGFWLFDTPCTQALWTALGLENPSRFVDPERPVEKVSWEDIRDRFLPALNERLFPSLDPRTDGFVLPSEAQWEYACRAGTDTALYTGPIEILGDMDAPALDPIAWYGGNSGRDYDLDEGANITNDGWWKDKRRQYADPKAGTRKVGKKDPNPWGLYDMLGNVWEWTRDAWHDRYDGAPSDGTAWESDSGGAGRAIRGGSWDDGARDCRCACRGRGGPGLRGSYLGFRCARVKAE